MRKRIWAVLLSVCLLVGLLPTTALAGGLTTVKTYAELVAALASQTGEIYLEPAADFGWPDTGTLSIPANTQIVVVDENEEKAPWEIPSGITVNFEWNTHGISCSTLTVNGTMHMAYSSQDTVLQGCDKVIIGPTCTFSCADDNPEYPTVYGAYIPAGSTWEVLKGSTLNPRVRLGGTLTGDGIVSGMVTVSGGSNATLSGNLTLTGGLNVGRSSSGTYADRLTIPAGSHIKSNRGTTISHATVDLNGVMEWEKVENSANSTIAAGGKIVMDGGKLIFNTPCKLEQTVFEWGDGDVMEYEKVQAAITEPLIDGTGVIRFNDKVSEAGQEHGQIMGCNADLVARTAQQVKAGTYAVADADADTWEPYYAIDLVNIAIERSWVHTWDEGKVTKEATCTEKGEKTYTCTDEGCGKTKTEEIPATGHTYGENGICTVCGAEAGVLYVNGVDMANGGEVDGASYDADTNTLTLNGASITKYYTIPLTGSATDPRAGIYYQGEKALNVVVSGGSTISVVPGVTGTSTAIPAFGIYADGPVNMRLNSYLNIQPGTADGAESDDKSDQGAKVLGGAVYVTGNMTIAGSSFLRYLKFGTFQYSGASGLQTANNYQMPFQVDGNLTVSNGPPIMGGEMKVGGNASVDGKLDLTAVVGNYEKVSNGISTVYAADATLDVGGTLDLTGGSVTIGSGCTRANYAGLKAGTLRQSGGILTLNNDEKNDSIQCDDLVQTGGTLTANCAVEAGSSAHLSGGSLTAAALTGTDITVGGTANVTLSNTMGGLGANITISGGTVNITSQTKGIQTGNLTVTGGTTTVTAPVALSFSSVLQYNCGNFSITGGTLRLIAEGDYYGSTIAIRWDDVSNRATDSTHFAPHVTVPVTPSGAKFLETVETLNGVALYAATYVAEGVGAITFSGGYASNGLTAITFGAEPCENHDWGDWVETQAPTCTGKGVETRTCSVCGETETQDITALGHDYVAVVTTPTCTAQGYTTHTCSRCGDSYVDTYVDASGHTWGAWTVTTPATCTEAGVETRTCQACGETESRDIDALGHDYEAVVTAPTCTAQGYTTHTCSRCGDSYVDTYTDALGHDYKAVVTAPTCTEQGYTTHTCSRCGDRYVDTYENALGHDWGEWVVDKEATETEDGSQHRDCSRCDAVDTQTISKLPKQNVYWYPAGPIELKYGEHTMVTNTAYNDTVEDCVFTYTSSNPNVAVMNEYGYAVIKGAGTTTITATAPAVPSQYAATSASYTLVINKASLTVTANDHAITYGQVPANNGWTADGLKYNDTESVVTGTTAYTYSYEQYGNAGSYAINVSGLTAKNYDITFAPGTLTVSKATDYTITLGNLTQRDDDITAVTASIAPQDATAQIKVEYQVDGNWTTSLPTAAGEYQVRASLTGSSNIQTDGAYTNGTLTIQRSIGVDGTDVTVTVDEGKANITVTEGELADIVDNADGDVSVNLGGVEGVDELVLPGSLLEALSESDKADSLTITTEDASISMSSSVLDTVASAITGEDIVAVKLSAVEKEDLNEDQKAALNSITQDAVIVEVSLVITHADGTETELHQLGGNVEVTVPYAGGVPEGKYIVVCYLSDDGNVTYVRATYNAETQQVTFTTNHFSNYAVFVSGDPAVVVEGGSGSGLYAEGTTVTIKADSKSGYTFAGWEVVSGGVTLADATAAETTFTMPAANVELKAAYTRVTSGGGGGVSTYTLTFDTNGGSKIDSVSKTSGTTIDLAGYITTRAGYDFDGWYSDAKLTDKVTSVKLTKDMTVYAKWSEKGGENPFTDVADDAYYADAVIWAVGEGITSGTTAATFTPNAPCTRAQAVTFLWRAAGSPEPESMSSFADVPADSYYAKAVAWAVEQGITKGTSDTTFSPNATCTRAQIVTFLWRSQKSPASDGVNPFTDVAADAYYANAVLWAAENGITGGTTATTFSPSSTCTRAQIVTFLYRAFAE